jgi:hypothetical protein
MNRIPTNLNDEQAEILTTLLQDSMRLLRDAASPSPISAPGGYSIIAQRIEDVLRACGVEE